MLELAILGLLHESPMHGYELRKRLTTMLGAFRAAFSYGTLYPTLRRLREAGWIEDAPDSAASPTTGEVPAARAPRVKGTGLGKRGKVVYRLTAEGKERFGELLAQAGPETWEDATFGVHFAFFGRTDAATRLRILEGRRRRVEERREGLRDALDRAAERIDAYTQELQRHGLEAADREVRWLEELIAHERTGQPPTVTTQRPETRAGDSAHPATGADRDGDRRTD
ncbi:PadR family transcriptional regulator [Actinocatenispora rupis]|uniref:PadR family transcriptional regulator n=1 Tax=Actinocatenispora rupis TaxID=519421 RepID=A0A8J3J7V8_9ACTN|nr:PadR family transcriptional regulator [Actinocatenispora rupis]GID13276.1 PadR family transcriptional regulator [Actinocatenispora rupis]